MKSLSLSKPHVIVMVGIPGSGKSFFAEHFAGTFNAPIINYARLHKELFGSSTNNSENEAIINKVANYLFDEVLKTGRTIVYDGQTDLRTERAIIAKKSRDAGYEPLLVWVQTESVTAKKRAIKTHLSAEQFDHAMKRFSAPHQSEKAIVISGKHTYNSQLKIILKHLVEPRAQIIERQHLVRPSVGRNALIR